jgi:hypothetical protein
MTRDKLSKTWRPFGCWMLTINVSFGFPGLFIATYLKPDTNWSIVSGTYAALLTAWIAAAGIRQWGKHNGEV